MKTTKETILEPILMVNSHHGVYVPKVFIQLLSPKLLKQIPEETREVLLKNPEDNEFYWDYWDEVLGMTFKHNGQKLLLEQTEDLWFIPACFTRTKEYKENWCN